MAAAAILCILVVSALIGGAAAEEGEVNLSFKPIEGKVLNYETKWTIETNFMGMDIVQTQNYKALVQLNKVTEDGQFKMELQFPEVKSSMLIDDEMRDWAPPIQLVGKNVFAYVTTAGEVEKVEPGGYIPGMKSPDDLTSIIEIWFIKLPDRVVKMGETWREDVTEDEEGNEGQPGIEGYVDFTLKKIEKKKDIEVAVIEAKAELTINQSTPQGNLNANAKGKSKYYIAIDGGYIVETKQTFEMKGKVVAEGTGDETDAAMTRTYETKLKK
jgi:hypothetical protein